MTIRVETEVTDPALDFDYEKIAEQVIVAALDYEDCPYEAEVDQADCFNPESGELMLGDIMISLDKVAEQAEKYGHSRLREYAFLIAHSMLHLMGYDHEDADLARDMEQRQEAILDSLGIRR